MDEDDESEDMVAMMDRSQWTGLGVSEPTMPPSLQQMFALAQQMGYEMWPAESAGTGISHTIPTGTRLLRLSVSAAVTWDTRRLVAQSQIQHFRSDRMAGTSSQMFHDSGIIIPHRETIYRPGPHPHRSACYSSGPHLIYDLHPLAQYILPNHSTFTYDHISHSAVENSVQFMDQGVATLTGASMVRSTDSLPIPDREVTYATNPTPADLLMHHPDTTCVERVDDSVMQISGTGHWFLEGWIGDHSVDFLVDSGSSVTAM